MVTIVTGPSHCGKSTYIQQFLEDMDTEKSCLKIDMFDYQEQVNTNNLYGLLEAQYMFYCAIEKILQTSPQYDIYIEGCFSNPYRIEQVIATVRSVYPKEEIRVIYILHDQEWYFEHLDFLEARYAIMQQASYELYSGEGAAVYKLTESNKLKEVN